MKRLTALLLCAALVLSLCAGGTFALPLPEAVVEFCSQEEWDVLAETNRERLREGLEPYSTFPHLQEVARLRSGELETPLEHVRPDGRPWYTAVTEAGLGYTSAEENIAAGYSEARRVVEAWMASPTHRENILDTSFAHMGVGFTEKEGHSTFWSQTFLYKGCPTPELNLSQKSTACPFGTPLEELGVYLVTVCPFHGCCYLPLLEEMCTGYDSRQSGTQQVSISCFGQTVTLRVEVDFPSLDTSSASDWAVEHIERADQLSLLTRSTRENFSTDITRAQFVELAVHLVELLTETEIQPAPQGTFYDTDDVNVLKAKAAGMTGGYPEGDFRPENSITRQEICVMLAGAVGYMERQLGRTLLPQENVYIADTFPDAGQVDSWAVYGVGMMTGNGVISGRDGWIAPQESTPLQEAVIMAARLYEVLSAAAS